MSSNVNIRPGRNRLALYFRSLANSLRTFIIIDILNRWVTRRGFLRLPFSVSLWAPNRRIIFGNRVQFGAHCVIHCDAEFGNNILVAQSVAFVGRDDHRFDVIGSYIWDSPRGDNFNLVVGSDVWIGHGAVVLSGVKIGTGSVVAAGSVVIEDVPAYSIVAGNPARVLRARFTTDQIKLHEQILQQCE